jgi:hypothetical protein
MPLFNGVRTYLTGNTALTRLAVEKINGSGLFISEFFVFVLLLRGGGEFGGAI